MLAGLLAVVAHAASFLDKWSEIGAFAGGVIAVLLVVWGVGRWLLSLGRRPSRLTITCGDTPDFNHTMSQTLPVFQELVGDLNIRAVHSKFLRVTETRGFIAREVRATITAVDPPDDRGNSHLPVKLRWWSWNPVEDIVPHGSDFLFLQTVICTDNDATRITPPAFDHHSPIDIEVTLHVAGTVHSRTRLHIEDVWPGLRLIDPASGGEAS